MKRNFLLLFWSGLLVGLLLVRALRFGVLFFFDVILGVVLVFRSI